MQSARAIRPWSKNWRGIMAPMGHTSYCTARQSATWLFRQYNVIASAISCNKCDAIWYNGYIQSNVLQWNLMSHQFISELEVLTEANTIQNRQIGWVNLVFLHPRPSFKDDMKKNLQHIFYFRFWIPHPLKKLQRNKNISGICRLPFLQFTF